MELSPSLKQRYSVAHQLKYSELKIQSDPGTYPPHERTCTRTPSSQGLDTKGREVKGSSQSGIFPQLRNFKSSPAGWHNQKRDTVERARVRVGTTEQVKSKMKGWHHPKKSGCKIPNLANFFAEISNSNPRLQIPNLEIYIASNAYINTFVHSAGYKVNWIVGEACTNVSTMFTQHSKRDNIRYNLQKYMYGNN